SRCRRVRAVVTDNHGRASFVSFIAAHGVQIDESDLTAQHRRARRRRLRPTQHDRLSLPSPAMRLRSPAPNRSDATYVRHAAAPLTLRRDPRPEHIRRGRLNLPRANSRLVSHYKPTAMLLLVAAERPTR